MEEIEAILYRLRKAAAQGSAVGFTPTETAQLWEEVKRLQTKEREAHGRESLLKGEAESWKSAWEVDHAYHLVWAGDKHPTPNLKFTPVDGSPNPHVVIELNGKKVRCAKCGGNIFYHVKSNPYVCTGCGTALVGEVKDV